MGRRPGDGTQVRQAYFLRLRSLFQGETPATDPLANATGMALSVDNPDLIGSYGTYTWHGSQDLSTLGCYTGDRVQDIDLYSVGGTGQQAKKSFHVHENHNRITPPPFASGGISATSSTPASTTGQAVVITTGPSTTAPQVVTTTGPSTTS